MEWFDTSKAYKGGGRGMGLTVVCGGRRRHGWTLFLFLPRRLGRRSYFCMLSSSGCGRGGSGVRGAVVVMDKAKRAGAMK